MTTTPQLIDSLAGGLKPAPHGFVARCLGLGVALGASIAIAAMLLAWGLRPDILRAVAAKGPKRPKLVVGFAAETDALLANARAKLASKGCDWIVANDVSQPGVMGGAENTVTLVTPRGAETWPQASKTEVARKLAERIAAAL